MQVRQGQYVNRPHARHGKVPRPLAAVDEVIEIGGELGLSTVGPDRRQTD